MDCEAVLLQVLRELLTNVIYCLVGEATNDDAGVPTNKMFCVISKRGNMAGTLKARNDFLRDCGFTCTCCTNQAEALTLQGKLNGSKLLVVEAHTVCSRLRCLDKLLECRSYSLDNRWRVGNIGRL